MYTRPNLTCFTGCFCGLFLPFLDIITWRVIHWINLSIEMVCFSQYLMCWTVWPSKCVYFLKPNLWGIYLCIILFFVEWKITDSKYVFPNSSFIGIFFHYLFHSVNDCFCYPRLDWSRGVVVLPEARGQGYPVGATAVANLSSKSWRFRGAPATAWNSLPEIHCLRQTRRKRNTLGLFFSTLFCLPSVLLYLNAWKPGSPA